MSDYAWFAFKSICYLVLIGFVCYWTDSAVPLWALLLMPSWGIDEKEDK